MNAKSCFTPTETMCACVQIEQDRGIPINREAALPTFA